jgi:hypothetical protein
MEVVVHRFVTAYMTLVGMWWKSRGLLWRLRAEPMLIFRFLTRVLAAVGSIAILAVLSNNASNVGTTKATQTALANYRLATAAATAAWEGPLNATVSDVNKGNSGYVSATYTFRGHDGRDWLLTNMWSPDMTAISNGGQVRLYWYAAHDDNDPSYGGVFVAPRSSHSTPLSLYDLSPTPLGSELVDAQMGAWFAGGRIPGFTALLLVFNILTWRLTRRRGAHTESRS